MKMAFIYVRLQTVRFEVLTGVLLKVQIFLGRDTVRVHEYFAMF